MGGSSDDHKSTPYPRVLEHEDAANIRENMKKTLILEDIPKRYEIMAEYS